MISARGTGEQPGQGLLKSVTDSVIKQIPGSDAVGLDYPASSSFSSSMSAGRTALKAAVQAYAQQCRGSRIGLLGYSQVCFVDS